MPTTDSLPASLRARFGRLQAVAVGYEELLQETISAFEALVGDDPDDPFNNFAETDPAIKIMQSNAFSQFLALQRCNNAFQNAFVVMATGTSLDYHGQAFGLGRNGESDRDYRDRILRFLRTRSTLGTPQDWDEKIKEYSRNSTLLANIVPDSIRFVVVRSEVQTGNQGGLHVLIRLASRERDYWNDPLRSANDINEQVRSFYLDGEYETPGPPVIPLSDPPPIATENANDVDFLNAIREVYFGRRYPLMATSPALIANIQQHFTSASATYSLPIGVIPTFEPLTIENLSFVLNVNNLETDSTILLEQTELMVQVWNNENVGQVLRREWIVQFLSRFATFESLQFLNVVFPVGVDGVNWVRIEQLMLRVNAQTLGVITP